MTSTNEAEVVPHHAVKVDTELLCCLCCRCHLLGAHKLGLPAHFVPAVRNLLNCCGNVDSSGEQRCENARGDRQLVRPIWNNVFVLVSFGKCDLSSSQTAGQSRQISLLSLETELHA